MADNQDDSEFVGKKSAPGSAGPKLAPEEELLRLRRLPTNDLVSELFFARQKLRTYLDEKGIHVPEFTLDTQTHKTLLNLTSSMYVENFNRNTIHSIGDDVESVNSSVKSFVMLFDSLISTNSFEQVTVSIEGAEESCTVKQLLEDYDGSRIDEDRKVVISVRDLKSQLGALIDEDSSGTKSFYDVTDDAIAATRSTKDGETDRSYRSRLGQGAYTFGEFSPFISQSAYDSLFSGNAENADAFFAEQQESTKKPQNHDEFWGESGSDGKNVEIFDDSADIPKEQEDIFDDFYTDADGNKKSRKEQQDSLSSDDIDKLIGSM